MGCGHSEQKLMLIPQPLEEEKKFGGVTKNGKEMKFENFVNVLIGRVVN